MLAFFHQKWYSRGELYPRISVFDSIFNPQPISQFSWLINIINLETSKIQLAHNSLIDPMAEQVVTTKELVVNPS